MPIEMMKEFIGKECRISVGGIVGDIVGKITEAEGDWIKIEESGKIRMINGDKIRVITVNANK